jgi:signal peptidase I
MGCVLHVCREVAMTKEARGLLRWAAKNLRIALPLLLILVARSSFANHYQIPSGSMEPTLDVGDRIFADMRAYGVRVPLTERWLTEREPARGDVVLFSHPLSGEVLVKRLVGLPGDLLRTRNGVLFVNGLAQEQRLENGRRLESLAGKTHLLDADECQGPSFGALEVPPRHYFMMGDHRGNSSDSRSWGFVPREKLLGKAVAILYSPRQGLRGAERLWIPLTPDSPPDPRLLR